MESKLAVKPVLSFRARIISIKDLAPGARVGYNARWTAKGPSRVAVLAAGYARPCPCAFEQRSGNCPRPVRSDYRHSFNGPLPPPTSPEFLLPASAISPRFYGTDEGTTQSVPDVARIANTASADLLCALGKRVPRFTCPEGSRCLP